ncbi:8932_t:CDS:2 [Funneliformis mosseae]|uniref:8932_t:CDS:1 n=1 Tax=Funneliformis mosseae TaxID=27381 RepID=A0A9N8W6E2_FUNMO|nr:8932_t:CDS:2 [Funneliformis mosseae]
MFLFFSVNVLPSCSDASTGSNRIHESMNRKLIVATVTTDSIVGTPKVHVKDSSLFPSKYNAEYSKMATFFMARMEKLQFSDCTSYH